MSDDGRLKRPDVWIGALLGTGLFVLIESLAEVGQPGWWSDFLSSSFYFNLVVLAAAGHYTARGKKIRPLSKRLLSIFFIIPFALLIFSAVLTPTEWFVGYGNWALIFTGMCSQILPASLLVFLFLILGQNFYKTKSRTKEIYCYSLAGFSALLFMVWFEGSIGLLSGVIFVQMFAATTFVVGCHAGRIAALRCSRS